MHVRNEIKKLRESSIHFDQGEYLIECCIDGYLPGVRQILEYHPFALVVCFLFFSLSLIVSVLFLWNLFFFFDFKCPF